MTDPMVGMPLSTPRWQARPHARGCSTPLPSTMITSGTSPATTVEEGAVRDGAASLADAAGEKRGWRVITWLFLPELVDEAQQRPHFTEREVT